jgi:GR25 family glycosyltransferase involved in LPS biosynthesis
MRHLIYYVIKDTCDINMFKISMDSLKKYLYRKDVDILVIKNKSTEIDYNLVYDIKDNINLNLYKFQIDNYMYIHKYDKILYMDVSTIATKEIDILFDENVSLERIHVCDNKNNDHQFLFRYSKELILNFKRVKAMIHAMKDIEDTGSNTNLLKYFFNNNLLNYTSILDKYFLIANNSSQRAFDYFFLNFLGNLEEMKKYVNSNKVKIYYINLEERQDRRKEIENELIGIPDLFRIERINATKHKLGAIGCSLSHIKTIEEFLDSGDNECIILEDDFVFTRDKKELKIPAISWDLIMLSGNVYRKTKYNNELDKVIDAQTTSGYMINRNFAKKLIINMKEGVVHLSKTYFRHYFALDMYWKHLQPQSKWYIFNPKFGKQREGFSDIENTYVNYGV